MKYTPRTNLRFVLSVFRPCGEPPYRCLQDIILPKLKQQLADTKGVFKGKERKVLTEQIQQTETKISAMLNALPDILKEDGYPDVRAFMTAYCEAEAVVEQYNRDLVEWECKAKESRRPAEKERRRPPEKESVRNRLRQLQAESRQKTRRRSFDRER